MLKLFLVEDEVVVREGIKNKIQWEDYGFVFAGEAADGESAYARILQTKPDVVITDIKMPFMDGLQLSELLHKGMPWVKIIILTGHEDFKYAQKAISTGVSEYLLKPVSKQRIIETIVRIKQMVESEREHQEFLKRYRQDMLEKEHIERQRFFENLISGKTPPVQLLAAAGGLNLSISAESYTILLFRFFRAAPANEEDGYSELLASLEDEAEHLFDSEERVLFFMCGFEGYALLVKGTVETASLELAHECYNRLRELFKQQTEIHHFIGIGRQVSRIQEIPESYETASRAIAHQYVLGGSSATKEETADLGSFNVNAINQRIIDRFLVSGAKGDEEYLVNDLFTSIGERHLESLLLRQYVAMNVYMAVLSFMEKLGFDREQNNKRFGDISGLSKQFSTLPKTRQYLIKIIRDAVRARDEKSIKRHSTMLQTAQTYIDEHFHDEDLSLKVIAREVNVSPSHFSAIFSQEMGCTFVEYLASCRIEKAKELLAVSDMRTAEIAAAVGYKDSHYFSFLFKKVTGLSPREFRAEKVG